MVVVAGEIGDIIQLTVRQLNQSQNQENVFFYRVEDTPTEGYLEGLCTEFDDNGLPKFADVQSTQVSYISLTARNIFNEDEFVMTSLGTATGTLSSGGTVPSFVSANIRLVRGNARVRHGRKAIGGACEANMSGQVWDATYLGSLQDLADWFAETQVAGGTDTFKPVIVGRVLHDADPPDHPLPWYALPTSQSEMGLDWAYVISGLADQFVSTQRSRKLGHGT